MDGFGRIRGNNYSRGTSGALLHHASNKHYGAGIPGPVVEAFWVIHLRTMLIEDGYFVGLLGINFEFHRMNRI